MAEFENEAGIRAFALAMAQTAIGVCLYDAKNRLVFWNHRCRELSGYPEHLFVTGITLDEQPSSLFTVGHQTIAEDEAFAGFQLDFETHSMPLLAAAC